MFDDSRRKWLKKSGETAFGAALFGGIGIPLAKGATPLITPSQTEGPFYPVTDQLDKDADMTLVKGLSQRADGEPIVLEGRVVNAVTLEPVKGALVEIWQACASGRYQHPDDPNIAALDPYFQYWAQLRTDAHGHFNLKTIVPGAYPASEDWVRPPHIHVKIHAQGYPSLTTQLYFDGHPLNDRDLILQRLPTAKQSLVVVPFKDGRSVRRWDLFLLPTSHRSLSRGEVRGRLRLTPEL